MIAERSDLARIRKLGPYLLRLLRRRDRQLCYTAHLLCCWERASASARRCNRHRRFLLSPTSNTATAFKKEGYQVMLSFNESMREPQKTPMAGRIIEQISFLSPPITYRITAFCDPHTRHGQFRRLRSGALRVSSGVLFPREADCHPRPNACSTHAMISTVRTIK